MSQALDPRDDIRKLHESRIEADRGIAGTEFCIDAWIKGLEENIKKRKEY